MRVQDVLKDKDKTTITVTAETPVVEAMGRLIANKISCLPVVDEKDQLVGIVSDKDIFRTVHENLDDFKRYTVGEVMTSDVIVGLAEDDISYIAGLMTKNRIRHVPIVEQQCLKGLVSIGDVVKTQMSNIEIENRYLKLYISGDYPA